MIALYIPLALKLPCPKLAPLVVGIFIISPAISDGVIVLLVPAFVCIATAGIDCFFVTVACFYTPFLLDNRTKNMKELTDT